MIFKQKVLLGLLFVLAVQSLEGREGKSPALTEVEVQWQADSEAARYHIEVQTKAGKFVKKFTSKKELFKFRAQAGYYKIRARTETLGGRIGLWTRWVEVSVPPKKVVFEGTALPSVVAQPDKLTAPVFVNWKDSSQEGRYEVQIFDENNNLFRTVETVESELKTELPIGKYFFEVVTIAQDGLRSSSVRIPSPIVIKPAAQLRPPTFKAFDSKTLDFSLNTGETLGQRLEYSPHLSEVWNEVSQTQWPSQASKGVLSFRWKIPEELPPGKYRAQFWMEASGWKKSSEVSWSFVIKPKEEVLESSARLTSGLNSGR